MPSEASALIAISPTQTRPRRLWPAVPLRRTSIATPIATADQRSQSMNRDRE